MSDYVIVDRERVTVIPVPEGARIMSVHEWDECFGRHCVIHNPSDHSMREFPLLWRVDRGMFERMCPHGIGHPDPDQYAYFLERAQKRVAEINHDLEGTDLESESPEEYADAMMTHGCDGCCGP